VNGRGPVKRPPVAPLVCPGCQATADADARFCPECGLPLVYGAAATAADRLTPVSEARRRARLIKPQLAEGKLTKVAWANNQPEGEFIQSLLLEEGVPSLLRRTAGFDVPDMLAAGPRDVMVPASGVDVARETLLAAAVIEDVRPIVRPVASPWRLLAGLLIALAIGAVVLTLVYLLAR
jgi:pimeloyl-ACP methyl ester carboxylesterase